MSTANEARQRVAKAMLVIGALLLLIGAFTTTAWRFFAWSLGGAFIAFGSIIYASVSIINGVPWLIRLISRLTEPVWDGELLHTDGSEYKVRYKFVVQEGPRFVASDVCTAVGMPAPAKDASQWGGVPLLWVGDHAYFTEAEVQTYLVAMAVKNHAASRLLVLIRNNVLRSVNKRREDEKRYGQEQG